MQNAQENFLNAVQLAGLIVNEDHFIQVAEFEDRFIVIALDDNADDDDHYMVTAFFKASQPAHGDFSGMPDYEGSLKYCRKMFVHACMTAITK